MNYTKLITFCSAIAITATGVFLVALPAGAKDKPVVVTAPMELVVRRVSYADLNLASARGERALHYRVGGAVRDLCNDATGPRDGSMSYTFAFKGCSNDAWDQADPQIARAIERSREIAATGTSSIAAAAITISIR